MIKMKINKESSIAFITFDRPKRMNAINSNVLDELESAINEIEADKSVRVIIFTGEGKAFIAGADIKELSKLRGMEANSFIQKGVKLFRRIEKLSIPSISAINGYCMGGGLEFALCTDIRYASENAIFSFPEAGLGLMPGFSGTQRLPRIIGISKTKEIMFTGKKIKAKKAKFLGMIDQVFSEAELMNKTVEFAESIIKNSSTSIKSMKRAIDVGIDLNIDAAIELEKGVVTPIFGCQDQVEGFKAFKEKRKPNFSVRS